MPAELRYIDGEVSTQAPTQGLYVPEPITLGPSWQPNDIRVCMLSYFNSVYHPDWQPPDNTVFYPHTPRPPAGFSTGVELVSSFGLALYWRRLTAADVDNVAVSFPTRQFRYYTKTLLTIRGVDPATNPVFFTPNPGSGGSLGHPLHAPTTSADTPGQISFPSMSVPAYAGEMVILIAAGQGDGSWATPGDPNGSTSQVEPTGSSIGIATGWTSLVATEKSGLNYYQYNGDVNVSVMGKKYAGSGTTGTVIIPIGYSPDNYTYSDIGGQSASFWRNLNQTAYVEITGLGMYVKPAPDVTSTGGNVTATASVTAGSSSTTTNPVSVGGNVTATASITTGYNPLDGYWISNPILLPGDPVTASLIEWDSTGPGVTVETSINAGLSWEQPTNGGAIPRLLEGDITTRQVLTRVTLHRDSTFEAKPKVHRLRVRASTDSGMYEWAPIAHGMIDKPKTKLTSGASGGGSTSSGGGSGASARGGGAFGGGQIITIHATDLSRSIKLAGWETPYVIGVGANYVQAAIELFQNRLPWLTKISAVPTTRVVQESALIFGLDQQQDPWQDGQELLASIGYECFFRPDGSLRIQPIPDPRYAEPVWTVKVSDRIMAEATRELSDEMIKNLVVVTGEASSSKNPISVAVQDDDPLSDTRVGGRLGKRVARARFPHITTAEQALTAAYGILYNSLSLADTITIKVPPIYVLEPGDAVRVEIPGVKALGTWLVQRMDTPLGNGLQELTLFKQSVRADFDLSA